MRLRSDEHLRPLLDIVERVGRGDALFLGDDGPGCSARDLAFIIFVADKALHHGALAVRLIDELAAVAQDAPGRHGVDQAGPPVAAVHGHHHALAQVQIRDDPAGILVGHLDDYLLHRFLFLAHRAAL